MRGKFETLRENSRLSSEKQNQPKTGLRDLSQTLLRFRDRAKHFREPRLRRRLRREPFYTPYIEVREEDTRCLQFPIRSYGLAFTGY